MLVFFYAKGIPCVLPIFVRFSCGTLSIIVLGAKELFIDKFSFLFVKFSCSEQIILRIFFLFIFSVFLSVFW